jgi:hypothetical protein
MSSIAAILKEEILRLARKEVRRQTNVHKKASVQYRRDIAEMKRRRSGHRFYSIRTKSPTTAFLSETISQALAVVHGDSSRCQRTRLRSTEHRS